MWQGLWPDRATGGRPDHSSDERRARRHRGSARRCAGPARPVPRRRLAGPAETRPPRVGADRGDPRRRAVASPQREQRGGSSITSGAASVLDRFRRGEPRTPTPKRPSTSSVQTCSRWGSPAGWIASYKRLHLLAADPDARPDAAARRVPGRSSSSWPARRTRRTKQAKHIVQGLFVAQMARPPLPAGWSFLEDYDMALAAESRLGAATSGSRPPSATGGQWHQRDEGRRSTARLQPQRARRLVGRSLRRRQRLGAAGRRRPRPPLPGHAPRPRAVPPARGGGRARVLRPRRRRHPAGWVARVKPRCARSIPDFSAARMLSEYDRASTTRRRTSTEMRLRDHPESRLSRP